MIKKKFVLERNKIFLFLILFGSLLIFKNFNNGFWSDEWATFYFSDPSKLNLILEGGGPYGAPVLWLVFGSFF